MTEPARPPSSPGPKSVVVLTGPSRAGKTTVCRRVIADARSRGLTVSGVLTEDGAAGDGTPLQIVRDLATGDCRRLAGVGASAAVKTGASPVAQPETASPPGARPETASPPGARPETASPPPASGAARLRWAFSPDGVAFGREALRAAASAPCDVLVVDQIGPLELRHGEGWTSAFDVVERCRCDLALLVVNPGVVDEACSRLSGLTCHVLRVDDAVRDSLPGAIASAYLRRG